MTENPYSPPSERGSPPGPRYSTFCACMFWLTSILSFVVAAMAVHLSYHNYRAVSEMGGRLPPYIVAVTLLVLGCAAVLGCSAVNWWKRRIRAGLLTLGIAAAGFFGGPWVLLAVLAG